MNMHGFMKVGHWPSLLSAFLYFDISFMVWVLLGALANSIVPDFKLNDAERGLMLALPLLGGSILRLLLGLLTDHIGARRTGIIGLGLTLVPLVLGWLWADSFPKILLVGLLLGVAGASFAAALPLASRWYPARYQGLAMGIAGAGNSGTALATLFAPMLAATFGWKAVFGFAMLPLAVVFVLFLFLAKDGPQQPAPRSLRDYAAVLRQRDAWWFCLFYSITFGGFVGLASFLNIFFYDQYGLTRVQAGNFATLCVVAGSFLRPIGGHLADRFGGIRMLALLFVSIALLLLGMTSLPALASGTLIMFVSMAFLGMGNGAVFQLVPQRFPKEIGVITGIVGAAGGIGGSCLPNVLGTLKQVSDSYAGGFLVFSVTAFVCAAALQHISRSWEGVFVSQGGRASSVSGGSAVATADMNAAPRPAEATP